MSKIILEPLSKALKTLDEALSRGKLDELMRDGAIQRFEYCIELTWKSGKKVLEAKGLQVEVPKDVFRMMAKVGWIKDAAPWFSYLEARNKTSHMYREDVAKEIFAVLPQFLKDAKELHQKLEQENQ